MICLVCILGGVILAAAFGITLEMASTIDVVIENLIESVFFVIAELSFVVFHACATVLQVLASLVEAMYYAAPELYQILTFIGRLLVVIFELVISGVNLLFQLSREGSAMVWNGTSSLSSFLYQLGNIISEIIDSIYHFVQLYAIFSYLLKVAVTLAAICFGIGVIFECLKMCRRKLGLRSHILASDNRSQSREIRQVFGQPRSRSVPRLFDSNRSSSHDGPESMLRRRRTKSPNPSAPLQHILLNNSSISEVPQPSAPPLNLSAAIQDSASGLGTTNKEDTDSVTFTDTHYLRRQLHQANEQLSIERDKSLCVICLDETRELVLKPCNHYCLCRGCFNGLRDCPICKRRIQRSEKIFHA